MASGEAKDPADSSPSGQGQASSQSGGLHSTENSAGEDARCVQATTPISAVEHTRDDPPPPGSAVTADEFFSDRPEKEMIPGYEILRELSRGGQGVVYQAIQNSTKRKVAVKVLLEGPYASKSAKRHFEREIELVSHLKHPNIISVFDSGETKDGRLFYVMEYVRGTPVTQYVREKKLGLEETLKLFAGLCDAVNHAHQKAVIHRDLKPSNILVDGEGNLKILDFGLARAISRTAETVTITGQVMGTLPYMSPEQTKGNPDLIDTRTDVYALGVILYEMLTGTYPYPVVGEMAEVLKHISETEPKPLTKSWTKESGIGQSTRMRSRSKCPIDDEVDTIVLKALAKEKERRYQSAADLGEDVRHYLANEPIEAKRDSAIYVLIKTMRRYRVPAALAIGFLLVLAVFAVFMAIARNRALRAEAAARESGRNEAGLRAQAQTHLDAALQATSLAKREAYLANISLAARNVQDGELAYADRLLDLCDPSLRRWEWAWLKRIARDTSRIVARIEKNREKALSPDGTWFAWVDDADVLSIKNLANIQVRVIASQLRGVDGLTFSPDSNFVACVGDGSALGRKIQVWSVATGKLVFTKVLPSSGYSAWSVAISQDGRQIAVSTVKALMIYDSDGSKEPIPLEGEPGHCDLLCFSPSGEQLVGAGDCLSIWDLRSRRKTCTIEFERSGFQGPASECARALAVSHNGRYAATGHIDGTLCIWDLQMGRRLQACRGHQGEVLSISFSPDDRVIASGGGEFAAAGPSGMTVAIFATDWSIRLWNVRSGKALRVLKGHEGDVRGIAYCNDRMLRSFGDDSVREWALDKESLIARPEPSPPPRVPITQPTQSSESTGCVGFTGNSQRLVAADFYGGIRVLDRNTLQVLAVADKSPTECDFDSSTFTCNESHVAHLSDDQNDLIVWDTRSGKQVLAMKTGDKAGDNRISAIRLLKHSNRLACLRYGRVDLYMIPSGEKQRTIVAPRGYEFSESIAESDGWLAIGFGDSSGGSFEKVLLFDADHDTSCELPGMPPGSAGYLLYVPTSSTRGEWLAIATARQAHDGRIDSSLHFYRRSGGNLREFRPAVHVDGRIFCVSPCGSRLAATRHSMYGDRLRIIDCASARELFVLDTGIVIDAGFSEDGLSLQATTDEGIKVWNIDALPQAVDPSKTIENSSDHRGK